MTKKSDRIICVDKVLRKLRKRKGVTQSYIAQKIDVSTATLSGYENGKLLPALDVLSRISKIYDVSLDYLVFDREESKSQNNYDFSEDFQYSLMLRIQNRIEQQTRLLGFIGQELEKKS